MGDIREPENPRERIEQAIGGEKRITILEVIKNLHALEFGKSKGKINAIAIGEVHQIKYEDKPAKQGTQIAILHGSVAELDQRADELHLAIDVARKEKTKLPDMTTIGDVEVDSDILKENIDEILHSREKAKTK